MNLSLVTVIIIHQSIRRNTVTAAVLTHEPTTPEAERIGAMSLASLLFLTHPTVAVGLASRMLMAQTHNRRRLLAFCRTGGA